MEQRDLRYKEYLKKLEDKKNVSLPVIKTNFCKIDFNQGKLDDKEYFNEFNEVIKNYNKYDNINKYKNSLGKQLIFDKDRQIPKS